MGLSWTAGATDAHATFGHETYGSYGSVSIKKVTIGGDPADRAGFHTSPDLGGTSYSLAGGETWGPYKVPANASKYSAAKTYTVTEDDNDKYELKSVTCEKDSAYGWKADTDSTVSLAGRKAAIKVGKGEHVRCTFWNKRKTGTIVVRKDLVPATDAGRFDLLVDGKVELAGAGDGAASAPVTVPTGTHRVAETGPDLDDYVRSTVCAKDYGKVVAQGTGPVDVPVGAGDEITCTIKNVRKAKLIVRKSTAPADAAMPKATFDFTVSPGHDAFTLTDGGEERRLLEPGKAHTVTEADPKAKGYRLKSVDCTKGYGDVATRTATVTPAAGEVVTCTFVNEKIQPAVEVVKTGPATAYVGDTLTFGFAVTNTGNAPLHGVQVGDDRCAPVVAGAKDGGDDVLDPGETWRYSCTMVAPAHAIGDVNPVVNTVTVEAKDEDDKPVTDTDQHATKILHPAIDIEKTGPATATAGALLDYTLEVTNPGDMPVAAATLAVTDARCIAAPVLGSVNGDATPGSLDPGDRWTYTCSVQSAVGQSSVVNVAAVEGADENGRVVKDEDTFTTALTQPPAPPVPPVDPPTVNVVPAPAPAPAPAAAAVAPAAQQVAGTTVTSRPRRGTARISGPRACPRTRVAQATVTGRQIRRVTFYVNGRRVRTVTRADKRGRFTLSLRTAALRRGATRVTARVQFSSASRTKARTLRVSIVRCGPRVVRPQFTG